MFIITLMRSLILRREEKKFPDLCLHCYPFLSSFIKTKFQWIPAVLTLSSYEVKLSLTLHYYGHSMHRYCAVCVTVWLCYCHVSRVKEAEYKLTNWPWQQTHFISFLPSYTKSTGSVQEHQVNLSVIINAPHLLNTCQCFSEVPFSTLNWNSPPGLTLCVFHWETGKRRRKWRHTWTHKPGLEHFKRGNLFKWFL